MNELGLLGRVHETYQKWLHIKNTDRIDVVLAVALSRKMEGTPLWLILVDSSGGGKSEQIMALDDEGMTNSDELQVESTTKIIQQFTPRTLVSGTNLKSDDLAPKLDRKIMLIPDFAQLLTLHPNDKTQVWSQLRELYDGRAGKQTGLGTDKNYKGIRVTLIGCATPSIDEQILIHQALGTRELIYRPEKELDKEKLMIKVLENEQAENEMKQELRFITHAFLGSTKIKNIKLPEDVLAQIKNYSKLLSILRASAPIDSYSGELRGEITPEEPTRILKQLKRLYVCLMSLDDNYPSEKAMDIIHDIVFSSSDQIRCKVINFFIKSENRNNEFSTNQVAQELKYGFKTIKIELSVLWHLGLLDMRPEEQMNNYGAVYRTDQIWSLNRENETIKGLDMLKQTRDHTK